MKTPHAKGIRPLARFSLLAVAALLMVSSLVRADGGFMSGSGTEADPYLVEDYADLKAVGESYSLDAVYRVTADIDASPSAAENSGAGFVPIGNSSTQFTGKFHGTGHLIKGLVINRPLTNYVGLFGYASGAFIDSLGLAGGSISGYGTVGSLTGYLIGNGAVSDCRSNCQVTGGYYHVGGLAGLVDHSTVNRCHSTGTVSGTMSFVGGLIGTIDNYGSVTESFATGSVSGGGCVGGLAGYNIRYSTVNKCYATGPVTLTAGSAVGGLVGYNKTGATISQSYSTGLVTGSTYVGGLVGWNSESTVNTSYWGTESSGRSSGLGYSDLGATFSATGLAIAAMKESASFSGWDFSGVWNIRTDSTYPGLRALDNAPFAFNDTLTSDRSFPLSNLSANDFDVETAGGALVVHVISTSAGTTDSATTLTFPAGIPNGTVATVKYRVGEVLFSDTLWGNIASSQLTLVTIDGGGTEGDPFLVANYTDLKTVGTTTTYNLGAVYRVTADIDASLSATENSGAGFVPIGPGPFTGTFHGAGHVIRGLLINRPSTDYVGLFGFVRGGTIDSLGMVDNDITGGLYSGGIASYIDEGSTVSHCFNAGSVYGQNMSGGIVSVNYGSIVSCCRNTGRVAVAYTQAGGIASWCTFSGNISYCCNTGSVSGPSYGQYIGGIAGACETYASVDYCYNTGDVSGWDYVGGITGHNGFFSGVGLIRNCYNTGRVSGSDYVGGIAGTNSPYSELNHCYNAGSVSGSIAGAIAGSNSYSNISYSYWDSRASGQSLACGDNGEGGTITAVAGLTTAEMKDPANLTNLDFVGSWAIRADSTYPALRDLDNAPFAFTEMLPYRDTFLLSQLLINDCDLETVQNKLFFHVISISAGTTDSTALLFFPGSATSGLIDTVRYRIGEVRVSDTLWGNVATSYIYVDKQAPLAVNLASPADGGYVKDSLAAFAWHPAIDDFGVGYYQMQCASDTSFIGNLRDTTVADTAVNLMLPDSGTICYWRVRAVDACSNIGPYSPIWEFEIDVASPVFPSLLTPADNAWLDSDTAFCSWSAVSKKAKASPVYYVLKAYSLSDTMNPAVVDTTALTMDTLLISQDRYRWLVETHDEAGNPPGISGYFHLGYDRTPPSAIAQISPTDSLTTNQGSTTFCWHPSTDAVSGVRDYIVTYAYDESFSTGLADTTVTDTCITLFLADSNYYWQIAARDSVGNINLSNARYLSIDTRDPAIPDLASPADSLWMGDEAVVCSWGEVAKKAKASEVSYVIQIDTANTFTSPIIEDTTVVSLDTFNLSEGLYYWRVMAYDAAGNYGTYSSYRAFGIDTTAPDIQYVLALGDDAAAPYGPYEVTSKVYDLSGFKAGWLFRQVNGGSWDSTSMFFASDSLRDSIPGLTPAADETLSVSYYIKALDMVDQVSTSSTYSFKAIGPLGVEGNPGTSVPSVFALNGAYPNPSKGQTTFKYQLPRSCSVSLTVYNVAGQAVTRFELGTKPAGYHSVNWNGSRMAAGVYIYRLQAGDFSSTKKLSVIR